MRKLLVFACMLALLGALAATAGADAPSAGSLSIEGGRGTVVVELRGSVLGLLAFGTLRVVDLTPRDRYEPIVVGRKLTEDSVGPRATVFRGQGLRFRMLGGRYRILLRGTGISLSAVGRGLVTLNGEARLPDDDVGVYSLEDGVDCSLEPELCAPLPEEPERFVLGPPETGSSRGSR